MKDIIVITGPTGVGKTALSISLAKKINAEIINADSMQFYKYLNNLISLYLIIFNFISSYHTT